ncbi:MAG TPA: hybrid sensor histidine kinase/response regulator, partial [Vicinamibacterales bacterium]|nr:hybrid sensor histidine kinase/response regulator [Vicinamibacterales bacterium]
QGASPLVNFEIVREIPGLGLRTLLLNARNIIRQGRETLLLLALEDVTDTRQAEAMRVDSETMRLMNKRKDEFLGVLAHELRNPLAPMRFALEVLRDEEADAGKAVQARQVLERQLGHTVRLVEDLLDVARITHGKVGVHRKPVDIRDVVSSAVELCQPVIDAAGHELSISLPEDGGGLVGDGTRLTQVVVNLLNNAVKFTPPGGRIQLVVERHEEDDPEYPNQMSISVRDSGMGIDPATLPRIFDMFVQGDSSLEGSHAGLGVGLTLVRNLVELHGGTVDVHSEGEGTGTEFVVMLPIDPEAHAESEPQATAPAPASAPLRILVADDYADGREMLAFLLERQGHTVMMAADGPGAIAAAAEFVPDVAILDIGMPGLSGYEVARELRGRRGDSLALVALSGLGEAADKARAAEAGFDRHFTKPIDINVLSTYLAEVGQQRRT